MFLSGRCRITEGLMCDAYLRQVSEARFTTVADGSGLLPMLLCAMKRPGASATCSYATDWDTREG